MNATYYDDISDGSASNMNSTSISGVDKGTAYWIDTDGNVQYSFGNP
jgi:hypothetical protein